MCKTKEREIVLGNLVSAIDMLQNCPEFSLLIPEVRVNLVYAPRGAKTPQDVAGVEGRITVVGGLPHASGIPAWGASDHMARRILEVRKYDAEVNAGIDFKYDDMVIRILQEYCTERRLLFGYLDRSKEPSEVEQHDRTSMPWKVKQLALNYGIVPRLLYEGPGWGKEPLCFALGNSAVEVAAIAIEIAQRYQQKLAAFPPDTNSFSN